MGKKALCAVKKWVLYSLGAKNRGDKRSILLWFACPCLESKVQYL